MRVLGIVIANGFSPEAKVLASLLAERDGRYEPLVLHHDPSESHYKDEGAASEFERASKAPLYRFDAGWRRNDDGTRSRLAKALGWALLHLQLPKLIQVARRHRPDVIYSSQQIWDYHLASLLARTLRVPQVIHLHYLVGPWLGRGPLRGLPRASGVVCISKFIGKEAERARVAPSRICVVPNTMRQFPPADPVQRDLLRAQLGLQTGAPTFVFIARLADGKGHEDALRAFVAVRDQQPNARLLIAGDGPQRRSLEALTHSLGLSHAVTFLGYRRDVRELLAASDFFVHPSRNEPFGLAILEASAAGLPTIAYRDAGPAEVIRHDETGLLIDTGNVAELAQGMLRLLNDRPAAALMGSRARDDLDARFDPRTQGARFAEFLATRRQLDR